MKTPAEWKTLFESSAFARQTNYSGPLGPEYNPSGTRLRLWAPTAQKVSVNLYRRGDGGACMGTLPLEQHGQGVWSVYLPGDQHGHYYTFTVEVDGTVYETGDPYARTAGVNGLRSMILDAPRIDPPDWNHDHRVIVPASRRTVWEVSVRDFSQDPACGVRNAWRGKFMAFTQKGTTLSSAGTFPTCLDYLKRLGVGYVQLMPIFDFGSVDESRPLTRQYNWGYDPTNYNVPEGSYSTDPTKGEVRVRECKEMIAALHAAGIGVIMDVVYNHMYRSENPLNSTVPYYFFRQNPDGSFSNGSGCGNEFASERPMARKYLIDSVLYWAQEYHIDGFRFDLMGLHDTYTMHKAEEALHAADPSVILYGEGWVGGATSLDGSRQCNKWNAVGIQPSAGAAGGVAVFSDIMRDGVKGPVFCSGEGGYVNGRAYENVNLVKFSSMGGTSPNFGTNWVSPSADRVINYVSAHDNLALWDKLSLTSGHDTLADRLRMNRMCAAIVLTSRGIPFFQAGEEMLRSKPKKEGGYEENSYNSPDSLNNMDWEALAPGSAQAAMRDYYRGLIAFRKAHPALRITGREEIEEATHFIDVRYDVIVYTLSACGETLLMIYNPLEVVDVPLPDGLCVSGDAAGDTELGEFSGTAPVPGKSVWCLVRKA